jgi:hypothetical protein
LERILFTKMNNLFKKKWKSGLNINVIRKKHVSTYTRTKKYFRIKPNVMRNVSQHEVHKQQKRILMLVSIKENQYVTDVISKQKLLDYIYCWFAHGEVYSIQLYVIKFSVTCNRLVVIFWYSGFLQIQNWLPQYKCFYLVMFLSSLQ